MTVTLNLKPEAEAGLEAHAHASVTARTVPLSRTRWSVVFDQQRDDAGRFAAACHLTDRVPQGNRFPV